MYIDVICKLVWFYCNVLRNDVFINKVICVKLYDMVKMIYGKVLRKGFHKTSLILLDLRFKIPSSKIRRLGQVEKKVEGLVATWESYQAFKHFD